ncbi:MAG: helix-turn-helix domain-containing protein [Mesorhizobium sp.]
MKLRAVFGLNVQRLRRERKLSQEQLSFVSGRTRAYISSVEAGRRNATLDTLEILAKALEVAPQDLIAERAPERLIARPARRPERD